MDCFLKSSSKFALKISLSKTKVMFTPVSEQAYTEPNILVNGTSLEVVSTLVYLSSMLARGSSLDSEIFLNI